MTTPRPILIATRNAGKVREIVAVLTDNEPFWNGRVEWRSLDDVKIRAADPEETEPTFAGNAALKARYWSNLTGLWTLADDSGLEVDALDGAPGIYSARYSQLPAPGSGQSQGESHPPANPPVDRTDRRPIDAANNRKLVAAVAGIPAERRTARFRCALAVADGDRIVATAEGAVEGRIIDLPRGNGGFGYDPHFLVTALNQTMAEIPLADKNKVSHRGQALRAMHDRLMEVLTADSPPPR